MAIRIKAIEQQVPMVWLMEIVKTLSSFSLELKGKFSRETVFLIILLFCLLPDQFQSFQHSTGSDRRSETTVTPAFIAWWPQARSRGGSYCVDRLFGAQGVAEHVTHRRYVSEPKPLVQ